jgi:protein-disulfide isomerase
MSRPRLQPTIDVMSRKRIWILVAGGAVAVATVLVLVTALGGGDKEQSAPVKAAGAANVSSLLRGIPQSGNVLGRSNAPVTLVEYADLQCPYCAEWATVAAPELIDRYVRNGKVRIEFRGLAFVGADSEKALRAVAAAGEQNKLWNVLELLYASQGTENTGWVTDSLLESVGASVPGLNATRMLADGDSKTVDAAILTAAKQADAAGISSTPSFQVGRSGGALEVVELKSLDAAGLAPALDELLKE